jgi:hypothetical protein
MSIITFSQIVRFIRFDDEQTLSNKHENLIKLKKISRNKSFFTRQLKKEKSNDLKRY